MKHDESIDRMLQSGILTEEQSESLKCSLTRPFNPDKKVNKQKISLFFLLASGIVLGFLIFLLFNGSTPEPVVTQDISETLNQPGVTGNMNSTLSKFLALFVFLILPILLFVWLYNGLATQEEEAHKAWAQVESNYQRRSDLIPNLVEAVGKYMKYETKTLQSITEERSPDWQKTVNNLVDAQVKASEILKETKGKAPTNEEYLAALQTAQQRIGITMRHLFAAVENYPQLRASDQMMQLQAQLEGTENRINVARMRFNEAVADFNASTRKLPASLVASVGGFQRKAYFKADTGSNNAIDIEFD